jgi:cytidine deaminase
VEKAIHPSSNTAKPIRTCWQQGVINALVREDQQEVADRAHISPDQASASPTGHCRAVMSTPTAAARAGNQYADLPV